MEQELLLRDRGEQLAHSLIEEFLQREGCSFEMLHTLPPERVKALMIRASVYASTKLAEIQNRADLVTSLHHVTESLT
jgi:hypothetical protein